MSFLDIGALLGRYEKIFSSQARKKDAVIEAVLHSTGFSLKEDQITVDGDHALVNAPHPIKNEIFLHKKKILDELRAVELFHIQ